MSHIYYTYGIAVSIKIERGGRKFVRAEIFEFIKFNFVMQNRQDPLQWSSG